MSNTRAQTKTPVAGEGARQGLFGGVDPIALLLEGRAFFGLIAIIAVFSYLSPNYFTFNNLLTMSSHVAIYGLLGLGMLLVILNGGIDLSVGSTLGLCGVMAGFFIHGVEIAPLGITLYPPIWVVAILVCGVGAFVGLINGILIARFRVPAFVATLGSLYAVRGVALLITNGLTYNNLGGKAALGNTGFDWLGFNRLFNIPVGVLVMIAVAIVLSVVLNRTAFGRWLYASGGNERAARLSGVPVQRVKVSVYVLSGVCAAIAGLVLSSELTSAGPTAGTTYELTAIATVVIGGAALTGGIGNVRGTLLGAFVIGFLSDGLVIVGVSAYWQMVFTGAVIVLAVLLNSIEYRSGIRRSSASPGNDGATPAPQPIDAARPPGQGSAQPVPQKTAG
ncbi:ABC transporter permease [Salinisphaera aquimarina]|uniref:ABC transporter permease n=1 Tax=Salinisphaera aquimarina TaxID=2094031 RepID=A0ABV7ESI7_9GAMM